MEQMLLRRLCVEEATERYPVTKIVSEAAQPFDIVTHTANERSLRQRTAFERGVQWA